LATDGRRAGAAAGLAGRAAASSLAMQHFLYFLPSRSPLLKAEAEDELCRANHVQVAAISGENEPVRHSSAGGINLQAEPRQSAGLFRRLADAPRQRLASKTHRRADAVELAARPPILKC
jgi:hypothetical protein